MMYVIRMTSEKLIRKRSSYIEWRAILRYLENNPDIPNLLLKIHELYDMKRAYRFNWVSEKSKESLSQLLKDEGY